MNDNITRREVLKRGLLGAVGLTLLPAVAAACNSTTETPTPSQTPVVTPPPATPTPASTPSPTQGPSRKVTFISSGADPSQLKLMADVNAAFTAATGISVGLSNFDYGTFVQFSLSDYLNGRYRDDRYPDSPGDVVNWASGFYMRDFADAGLIAAIDDVWARVSSNFSEGFAHSTVGNDGRVYAIPVSFYPFCMFYRKSVWAAHRYEVPTTWKQLLALCARMQKDKLTPIAFGAKDRWPTMATFDILNLRLNGYRFHIDLLAGKEKWTDRRVTAVFEAWRKLLPFCNQGYLGQVWQDACAMMVRKAAGMYFLGTFITSEVARDDANALDDLDCFTFPFFENEFDAERSLDAPVEIVALSVKSPNLPADLDNARAYLEFWAKGSTQLLRFEPSTGLIPTASDVDTSLLDPISRRAVQIVGQAKRLGQFLDRDTRPDFAGWSGMQGFLLDFLNTPGRDLPELQKKIQAFWDGLPPYTF